MSSKLRATECGEGSSDAQSARDAAETAYCDLKTAQASLQSEKMASLAAIEFTEFTIRLSCARQSILAAEGAG